MLDERGDLGQAGGGLGAAAKVVHAGQQVAHEDDEAPHVDVSVVGGDDEGRAGVGGSRVGLDEDDPVRRRGEGSARRVEALAQDVARRAVVGGVLHPAARLDLDPVQGDVTGVGAGEYGSQRPVTPADGRPGPGEDVVLDGDGEPDRDRHPRPRAVTLPDVAPLVEGHRQRRTSRGGRPHVETAHPSGRQIHLRDVGQAHAAVL